MRRTLVLVAITAVGVATGCGDERVTGTAPVGPGGCGSEGVTAAFLGGSEGGGLFPSDRPGAPSGSDVWVITADGEYRRLTEGLNSRSPWLSADGQTLYFVRSEGGIVANAPAPGIEGWRVDLDSGEEELLVRGRSVDGLIASPDGLLIAYSSNPEGATDFVPTIKIAEAAEPDRPTVIIDGDPPAGYATAQTAPAFSPDGRLLAYVSDIQNAAYEQSSMIRLFDLETGEDSVLYTAPFEERLVGLEWLPDQSRILAVRNGKPTRAASIDPITGRSQDIEAEVALSMEWASADGTAVSGIGVPPEDWELGPDEIDLFYMTWTDDERVDLDLPETLAYAYDLTVADCTYRDR